MKFFTVFICACTLSFSVFGQKVANYDGSGNVKKTVAESVSISFKTTPPGREKANLAPAAAIILGPVYHAVFTRIKNAIEKRKKSFVASYSNSISLKNSDLTKEGKKQLIIERYAFDVLKSPTEDDLMATYIFQMSSVPDEGVTIELESVHLKRSKARYKESDNLAISITLKFLATMIAGETTKESESIEGDGTIVIPIIKVTNKEERMTTYGDVINKIFIPGIDLNNVQSTIISASIVETNISRLNPSIVQDILVNSGTDIQAILKAIFKVED